MAEESEAMHEAVVTLRNMTEDEKIKQQCWVRQRYEADKRSIYNTGLKRGMEQRAKRPCSHGYLAAAARSAVRQWRTSSTDRSGA